MKPIRFPLVVLTMLSTTAWAQDGFQLPRECSERNNPHPEKCVIQDGPARAPWVHRAAGNAVSTVAPTQPALPSPAQRPAVVRKVAR